MVSNGHRKVRNAKYGIKICIARGKKSVNKRQRRKTNKKGATIKMEVKTGEDLKQLDDRDKSWKEPETNHRDKNW